MTVQFWKMKHNVQISHFQRKMQITWSFLNAFIWYTQSTTQLLIIKIALGHITSYTFSLSFSYSLCGRGSFRVINAYTTCVCIFIQLLHILILILCCDVHIYARLLAIGKIIWISNKTVVGSLYKVREYQNVGVVLPLFGTLLSTTRMYKIWTKSCRYRSSGSWIGFGINYFEQRRHDIERGNAFDYVCSRESTRNTIVIYFLKSQTWNNHIHEFMLFLCHTQNNKRLQNKRVKGEITFDCGFSSLSRYFLFSKETKVLSVFPSVRSIL